jgi:hypothetical protein
MYKKVSYTLKAILLYVDKIRTLGTYDASAFG